MKAATHSVLTTRSVVVLLLGGVCGCLLTLLYFTQTEAATLPVIAFVPRTTGTNLTEDMRRGAQAAAQAAGYRLYWNGPTREDDLNRQIIIAEKAIQRGARALILGPTNIWGVTTMVNDVIARRIPVVFVQTKPLMLSGPYLTSVTPNQAQFGELAANRIVRLTGGSGEVAIVGLERGTPETLARAHSFMQAIAAYPDIQVVTKYPGAVQMLEAEQSTREIIRLFPQLTAIFALSADATQGAILALQDMDPHHAISLVGCDRDLFLTDSLRSGQLDSLVTADPYKVGYLAVQAAVTALHGHALPAPQYMDAALLTRNPLAMTNHQ